jgi:biopolymer transport protein ExbB/TolQ
VGLNSVVQLGLNMDIQQERNRIKKWIAGYLVTIAIMFVLMFIVNGWFIIPAVMFELMVLKMFKDIKKLEENNVQEDIETKQINQEVNKMEKTNEEKTLLLETLSKDEELNLFLKVTNGQAKFALFEKLRAELETKPAKKAGIEKPKEAEKAEDEDIVVED